jgi:hypothetical protein
MFGQRGHQPDIKAEDDNQDSKVDPGGDRAILPERDKVPQTTSPGTGPGQPHSDRDLPDRSEQQRLPARGTQDGRVLHHHQHPQLHLRLLPQCLCRCHINGLGT